jgi:hypothetical protein
MPTPIPPRPTIQTASSFTRALASKSSTATITKRPRSSSIVSVTEIPENYDDTLDQGALNNVNADWVNYKGEYLFLCSSFSGLCRLEQARQIIETSHRFHNDVKTTSNVTQQSHPY